MSNILKRSMLVISVDMILHHQASTQKRIVHRLRSLSAASPNSQNNLALFPNSNTQLSLSQRLHRRGKRIQRIALRSLSYLCPVDKVGAGNSFQVDDGPDAKAPRRAIATIGSIATADVTTPPGSWRRPCVRLTYSVTKPPPIINGPAVYTETIIPC